MRAEISVTLGGEVSKVGDELTNRFGERCVIKAVHPDCFEIAVHRKPETAFWDLECWRQECAAAAALRPAALCVERQAETIFNLTQGAVPWHGQTAETKRMWIDACAAAQAVRPGEVERPCTCHTDDNPPKPCPRRYALQDCRAAALARVPSADPTRAAGGE